MDDLIGTRLGQYEILDHIADGGMASVYRAYQPSMKRDVAIKILPSRFTKDTDFLERFSVEVQAIAKLQHPHILPVYDYGSYDDNPFVVMAYLNGGSLADKLANGACSLEDTLKICGQIATAIDFAHSKGIVHRDFKPGNVLLDEQQNAYLADFGLAKILEEDSQITAMNIIGTPAYMAPEQAKGESITGAVDVYALGAAFYEMLTGDIPYTASTSTAIIIAHLNEPIPSLTQSLPDLPYEIDDVFERVLAKDPADRYQTAGDFIADLNAVLSQEARLSDDMASQIFVPQPALLMTNMIGHVIFVDNPCLNLLHRHQHEVRTIMGQPLHQVLGIDTATVDRVFDAIKRHGEVGGIDFEIKDSRDKNVLVTCSGLATLDERGKFVGADIRLMPAPKAPNRPPSSGFETIQPEINTQETSYLQAYFVAQLEALYALSKNWGGKRIAVQFEKIINETGQRNVWPISMEKGRISVDLKKTDMDMYRALLARSLGYAAHIVGNKQVIKEMEYVNNDVAPHVLAFVQTLGLDTLYLDILD